MFTTSDADLGANLDPDHRLLLRLVFTFDIRFVYSLRVYRVIRLCTLVKTSRASVVCAPVLLSGATALDMLHKFD